jgi:hypothetical protein
MFKKTDTIKEVKYYSIRNSTLSYKPWIQVINATGRI